MAILDNDHIRSRRQQLQISQRQLARNLGVTAPTVDRLEDGDNHPDLTLGLVQLLADALQTPPAALLADTAGDTRPAGGSRDAAAAGALLYEAGVLTPVEDLADALGFNLARTEQALSRLDETAPQSGLALHRLGRKVGLVRHDTAANEDQVETIGRARFDRRELKSHEAEVLKLIIDGADSRSLQSNAKRTAVGRLRNAGYLTRDNNPELTDDVRFSLMLD